MSHWLVMLVVIATALLAAGPANAEIRNFTVDPEGVLHTPSGEGARVGGYFECDFGHTVSVYDNYLTQKFGSRLHGAEASPADYVCTGALQRWEADYVVRPGEKLRPGGASITINYLSGVSLGTPLMVLPRLNSAWGQTTLVVR